MGRFYWTKRCYKSCLFLSFDPYVIKVTHLDAEILFLNPSPFNGITWLNIPSLLSLLSISLHIYCRPLDTAICKWMSVFNSHPWNLYSLWSLIHAEATKLGKMFSLSLSISNLAVGISSSDHVCCAWDTHKATEEKGISFHEGMSWAGSEKPS